MSKRLHEWSVGLAFALSLGLGLLCVSPPIAQGEPESPASEAGEEGQPKVEDAPDEGSSGPPVPAPEEGDALATPQGARTVHRMVVDGPISPAVGDYLESAIAQAASEGSAALILELDTPGGLLNSTQTIVQDLLAAPLPVIVWVTPSGAGATSAGVFITMAGHLAVMSPGSTIGAAHPVGGGGEDIEGDMRAKVENFTASFGSSIAEQRGRNVAWAEKAVRESVSITSSEAVELGVVDYEASSLKEVLEQAAGREVSVASGKVTLDFAKVLEDGGPRVVNVEMTLRQRVLSTIADPNIAYLLMMAAMLGLYMEFSNPGGMFPGVIGAICLLLALMAGQVLPISSVALVLVLLGMGFLLAELVTPSFGVLGTGGIVALTLGSLFLYTPESGLEVDRRLIAGTVGFFAASVALVLGLVVSDRRRRPRTGSEGLVGQAGVVSKAIRGSGTVKVHGEIWSATCDEEVASGGKVEVVAVDGMTLRVRAVASDRS